jgi:hypothetical protein
MKQNDQSDALAAYQKSLQINPNNPTLKVMVDNLSSTSVPAANTAPAQSPSNDTVVEEPPVRETYVVKRKVQRSRPEPAISNDGLASMDHAKFWSSLQFGYTYSTLDDFSTSAANINNGSYVNQDLNLPVSYTGSSTFSNSGIHLGAELGILLNPYMGIAIGGKYIAMGDYNANVVYQNSLGDFENETLSPVVIPITLDYYLFLPDSGGRFFISAGLGYYASAIHVSETYSYSNFYNQIKSTQPEIWTGDLYSGNIGFQLGIGREFAITNRFGFSIYAQGHYSKITNYRGTVYDQNGNSYDVGLATGLTNGVVEIDGPGYINSANGERYTTLDFVGFDLGIAFNWYTF